MTKSRRKVERKLKKFYPSVISIDLLFKEDNFSKSKVFEWMIVNQLKAEFFWRDPYKNEVDIVALNKNPIPIEVKYGKLDFKGLGAFMRKFKTERAFLISYDKEGKEKINGKTVEVTPAFKFLLEKFSF